MLRTLTHASLACSLALVSACNRAPKGTSETGSSNSADTASEPQTPRPPANTFVSPSEDQLTALSNELANHLAAAREATDPTTQIAALERALAIHPFDAATLAELGKAQTSIGQVFEAAHAFELALRHADDTSQRAAMLLELGIVTESLGNSTRAAELYNASVSLDPTNEAAAARLTAITAGVEVLSHSNCGWTRHGPAAPELCPAYVQARDASPSTCVYTHPPLALDDGTRVELFSHRDPAAAIELYVINVIQDGLWYSAPLTWVSHPAAEHADENVAQLELRFEQLAPEPKPQVLIEWQLERRFVDPLSKQVETRTTSNLGVLSVGWDEPRWWLGLRTGSSRSVSTHGHEGEPTVTRTSVDVKWLTKTGDFELRTEHSPSGTLGKSGKFALGAYELLCPAEIDAD